MHKHFMTELGYKEEKGSKLTQIPKKNVKSVSPQPVAHNLQNVPNEMTQTI